MLSIVNIKTACSAVTKDPRCGWKQAISSLGISVKPHIKLQRRPVIPKVQHSVKDDNEFKIMEKKFGPLCKSVIEWDEDDDDDVM